MRLRSQGFFPARLVFPRLFTPGLQFYGGSLANLGVNSSEVVQSLVPINTALKVLLFFKTNNLYLEG